MCLQYHLAKYVMFVKFLTISKPGSLIKSGELKQFNLYLFDLTERLGFCH